MRKSPCIWKLIVKIYSTLELGCDVMTGAWPDIWTVIPLSQNNDSARQFVGWAVFLLQRLLWSRSDRKMSHANAKYYNFNCFSKTDVCVYDINIKSSYVLFIIYVKRLAEAPQIHISSAWELLFVWHNP